MRGIRQDLHKTFVQDDRYDNGIYSQRSSTGALQSLNLDGNRVCEVGKRSMNEVVMSEEAQVGEAGRCGRRMCSNDF